MSEASLAALDGHENVGELRIRTPSLEEIFVAYLKQGESSAGQSAAQEVVVP
jgi:hypothetical protein